MNYHKYIKYKTKYLSLQGNKTIEIHVQEPWFSLIKDGIKTVEGRLNKGLFANLEKGVKVTWFNMDKKTKEKRSIDTIITDKIVYVSFEEMLESEQLKNVLPNIKTVQDGVSVYRQWYDEKSEKQYGVVAIRLKLA